MTLQLSFQSVMGDCGVVLFIKAQRACTPQLQLFLLGVYITLGQQQADCGPKCKPRAHAI